MLSTGEGEPSHIMALYSDVPYAALLPLALVFDISDDDFARAYIHARSTYAAANAIFNAFVLEMEVTWETEGSRAGASVERHEASAGHATTGTRLACGDKLAF